MCRRVCCQGGFGGRDFNLIAEERAAAEYRQQAPSPTKPLAKMILAAGLPSRHVYVDWRDGPPVPPASIRLSASLANPFFFGLSTAARVRSLVEQSDVVHVHGMFTYLNYIAGRYCKRYGKAPIYHPYGTPAPALLKSGRLKKGIALQALEHDNFRYMTARRALSSSETQQIRDFYARSATFVVPNGVEIPRDTSRPAGKSPKLAVTAEPGKRIFLFISRVSKAKGLDLLVDAWHSAAPQLGGCEFWIAGVGRDGTEQGLRTQARSLGVRGLSIVGSVSEYEKDWLFRPCDLIGMDIRAVLSSFAVVTARETRHHGSARSAVRLGEPRHSRYRPAHRRPGTARNGREARRCD